MGPHAGDCLQTLWDFWCNPEAGGSPSQGVLFVEGWNTMTINAVYHQISNLNDRALVGSQPALTQCYGRSKYMPTVTTVHILITFAYLI